MTFNFNQLTQNYSNSWDLICLAWDEDEYEYFNGEEEEEEQRGPALDIYGTDLTVLAKQGAIEECFGRENELYEMMEILVRRQKNNPVLVGDAGVGKTAIVELFATKIVQNLVPFVLQGRSVVSLDLARIVAGSRYRGEFELRFQRILDEVLAQPHIIIFIDEIHNIGGTGSAEGSLDAANILKPVLSRSGFQCIGATTTKEYQRIEKDPALNRRFQPVKVNEPSVEETVKILYNLRPSLEAFHNVEILPGALRLAVELSNRYIYERFLPDKAIDLVDRAAARQVIEMTSVIDGSVLNSMINGSLNQIGILKVEAFRRGDVATEFIFQEIENAYRNFIVRWIQDPLTIPEERQLFLSPISQNLFDQMRLTVLRRVDELLFSSYNPRYSTRRLQKVNDLSVEKNKQIYEEISSSINKETQPHWSVYRASLYLLNEWLIHQRLTTKDEIAKTKFLEQIKQVTLQFGMYSHIKKLKNNLKKKFLVYSREEDFYPDDIESYEETFEYLSELEEKRVEVFKEFLLDLKPILRKGIVQSLKFSSKLELSDSELVLIYNLLGYFSTDTGRTFLSNLEDPEVIQMARKLSSFSSLKKQITQSHIQELMSHITGIPVESVSAEESEKLVNLEKILHTRVVGQNEAIKAIANAIRRSRLGIQNPNRPLASFLFCGPTGVGKTEVTKALACTMFGSENDMIRFDMSEFMEKFTISRLVGSPPGYVGYDEGGQLTDAVRSKPYSVVLFDEIEKAHPDILNILLQILEDGRLTDSQKRLVKFENTIIIMTSNAGADEIQDILKNANSYSSEEEEISPSSEVDLEYNDPYAGVIKFLESPIKESFFADLKKELRKELKKSFLQISSEDYLKQELNTQEITAEPSEHSEHSKEEKTSEKNKTTSNQDDERKDENELTKALKAAVLERLGNFFLPEFLNRLDDIIIFKPLRPEELRRICDIMLEELNKRLRSKNILLTVAANVKSKLSKEGYNPLFGARPLRRLITKHIEDLICDDMLKNPIPPKGRTIHIILDENDKIVVSKTKIE